MNNFVFSQDPLLYSALLSKQNPQTEYDMRQQLDNAIAQYQMMANQQAPSTTSRQQTRDYLGEVDDLTRGLDEDVMLVLSSDIEYMKANEDIQRLIQEEIVKSIKWKINSNPEAVTKLERMKDLIASARKNKEDEDKKVMADLNDYIKNYSDLTFEEYKQLKYSK
jgi:hypothetical protein